MPLSDIKCRNAKSARSLVKLSDGEGLQLWVFPNGSRLWRLAYRYGGKQKLLALGSYPSIGLARARELRAEAKALLSKGIDPSLARKQSKVGSVLTGDTFKGVGEEYVEKRRREHAAETTLSKITWLLSFAYPSLGHRPLREITATEVLAVLRTVERRGRYESARRLRSTISSVFRYGLASGKADTDPTYGLSDALTRPVVHPRSAITSPEGLAGLLRAIDGFDGQPTTRAALQLMALLFPRPGELRAAEWTEFDLSGRVWVIPASRAKMRREHRVPLALPTISILQGLLSLVGPSKYLFPSVRTVHRHLSESTLNAALRRLGYTKDEATAHGFRATASTLLNQAGLWHQDAIERQLGHLEQNDVRRAYMRGEFWDERVRMMAWWANYLDQLRASPARNPVRKVHFSS